MFYLQPTSCRLIDAYTRITTVQGVVLWERWHDLCAHPIGVGLLIKSHTNTKNNHLQAIQNHGWGFVLPPQPYKNRPSPTAPTVRTTCATAIEDRHHRSLRRQKMVA